MPFVRNIVNQWQPRNCDPMVDFLDSWVHIIPVWILDNILDQLIFPKLQKEVGLRPGDSPGQRLGAGGALLPSLAGGEPAVEGLDQQGRLFVLQRELQPSPQYSLPSLLEGIHFLGVCSKIRLLSF